MKFSGIVVVAVAALLSLFACSHGQKQAEAPAQPATTKLQGNSQKYTGQVVLVAEGYRFRPNDSPDDLFRMTRATRPNELTSLEIHLRKYYGKSLVVRGKRQDNWLWEATVLGQWLKPGESAGPVVTAPPEPGQ